LPGLITKGTSPKWLIFKIIEFMERQIALTLVFLTYPTVDPKTVMSFATMEINLYNIIKDNERGKEKDSPQIARDAEERGFTTYLRHYQ
jgi:hypothetical protein